jgi:ABC-type transport system involved in multi-copper enzyme maturation permease subunit
VSALIRSELLKLRTTRTSAVLVLWMVGLVVLVVALHVFAFSTAKLSVHDNQLKVFGWGTGIASLFAALVGALSITAELRHGTIRPTLLATPQRARVIGAKVIASALAGLVVGALAEGLVTGLASAGIASRGVHNTLTGGDVVQLIAGGAGAAAMWAMLGTGLGALVRNQIGAIVGLCVWLLLVESVLIGNVPSAGKYSPGATAGALAGAIQNVSHGSLLAPGIGALLLAGYAAIAAAAGLLTIERRDIT